MLAAASALEGVVNVAADERFTQLHASPSPRDTPSAVGVVWALLVMNSLGSIGLTTIVPIPKAALQVVTMGSLTLAFAIALAINPRVRLRPNSFLVLLTLLLLISCASSLFLESGYGALIRCARFTLFIATLWLITRWWGDGLRFVGYHVRMMGALLLTVALGLLISPGTARPADFDNRLVGVIWPITATQVADYAAVVAGLVTVMWLTRTCSNRTALGIAVPATILLILSHTRTAILAMLVAVVVAGLPLLLTELRVRRSLLMGMFTAAVVGVGFAGPLMIWLQRGQDEGDLASLTGRQLVWDQLLAAPRTPREQLLGIGLTDKSFGGLPIDSTWLTIYYEQGLVGVAIAILIVVSLLGIAILRQPSPARACAIFLVVYCVIASFTQTGLGDVSSYLLHYVLAAILLIAPTPSATSVMPNIVVTEAGEVRRT